MSIRFFRILTVSTFLVFSSSWLPGCEIIRTADLILTNGNVYTFTWDDPARDGTPAANAPHDETGWHPDAEAVP